jgi:hypothetical protein
LSHFEGLKGRFVDKYEAECSKQFET